MPKPILDPTTGAITFQSTEKEKRERKERDLIRKLVLEIESLKQRVAELENKIKEGN